MARRHMFSSVLLLSLSFSCLAKSRVKVVDLMSNCAVNKSAFAEQFDLECEPRAFNALIYPQEAERLCREISAIILLDGVDPDIFDVQTVLAYTGGRLGLPVISAAARTNRLLDDELYPTYKAIKPARSEQATVMRSLLNRLSFSKVTLIHSPTADGQAFRMQLEQDLLDLTSYHGKTIQLENVFTTTMENNKIIQEIGNQSSTVVIMHVGAEANTGSHNRALQLVNDAKAAKLLVKGYVWILTEFTIDAVRDLMESPFSDIFQGFLGTRYRSESATDLNDLDKAVQYVNQFVELTPRESVDCDRLPAYMHVKSGKRSRDTEEFVDTFTNVATVHEIVNFQSDSASWQVVGNHTATTLSNLGKIEWIGKPEQKPSGTRMPRDFVVVTSEDIPFVFVNRTARGCSAVPTADITVMKSQFHPCQDYRSQRTYCCGGIAIDLLFNISQHKLNTSAGPAFTFTLHLVDSTEEFADEKNPPDGKGPVGYLELGRAEVAAAALTVSSNLQKLIDYSKPFNYHGITIIQQKIERKSPLRTFLQPFRWELWVCIVASVLAISLSLLSLDKLSPLRGSDSDDDDGPLSFSQSMWFAWGVLLNSGIGEKTPRSCSARTLGLIWCGFAMIIISSYTANLAAFLVLDRPATELRGITDPRLRDASQNIQLFTVRNSSVEDYFKSHVELSTIHRNMEGHNVRSPQEGIGALGFANDSDDGVSKAFVWTSTFLEYQASKQCHLVTAAEWFGKSSYAFGLRKESPWLKFINDRIVKSHESTLIEEILSHWITYGEIECKVKHRGSAPTNLKLKNMKDPFILVGAGILVGCIGCVVEVLYTRRRIEQTRKETLAAASLRHWGMGEKKIAIPSGQTRALVSPKIYKEKQGGDVIRDLPGTSVDSPRTLLRSDTCNNVIVGEGRLAVTIDEDKSLAFSLV